MKVSELVLGFNSIDENDGIRSQNSYPVFFLSQ